jgi:hypothetical protein
MIDKFYFYILNIFFKLKKFKIVNIINLVMGYFNNKYKKYYYLYKFYKRNNKKYETNFFENIYPPKIFLIKNTPIDESLFVNIKKYIEQNPKNEYADRGHKNIYQSLHNLNDNIEFKNINQLIISILNRKIIPEYKLFSSEAKLNKLWFTITKKSGVMKKHHHLDGELSGILYLKCDNVEKSGLINFYNNNSNLIFYKSNNSEEKFKLEIIKSKVFTLRPCIGDLIIFDSYIDHSVDSGQDIISDRISMPWDASLQVKD